ncbi:unnamed protein product [Owenia fusiformis]|uniref:RNA helicase n=1 Tax=Owenia fusiformis TaxID=6347 RepID=A0A8J1Y4U9_OWEFU|nr:unnamed protein product [Owenia fusiformis]
MADDDWAALVDQQESNQLSSRVEKNLTIGATAATKQVPLPGSASVATGHAPAVTGQAPAVTGQAPVATNHVPGAGDANGEAEQDEKELSAAEQSLLRKKLSNQLVATKADLEILQKDPNSPLYSVKSFEALNLKPELLKGVYEMGFNSPSKIQETALPTLLADPPMNMIAQSQSGTGKTAAFVLTMLSRVDTSKPYTQCICLSPTFELALQTGKVTEQMAKHMTSLKVCYAVRGERVSRGQKIDSHIIIGTPGTLLDWCIKFKVIDMKRVDVFVLDEADVMIATQGHQDQSIRIQKTLRKDCQMLLFSATYEQDVMQFAKAVVPNPVIISLRREEESLSNIKQYYINCKDKEAKFQALSNIYGAITVGQSMIFCHTRRTAAWLCEKMIAEGHAVALLSGELTVEQRAAVIERFRDGKEKVLITTNLSARGIDIEQVTVVVNFDLPVNTQHQADCETYLHRIGRTGRFGKNGIALNFVDGHRSMQILKCIESHFNRAINKLDAEDFDEIEKIGQ